MKKLLGILVLGLLVCNIAQAKECEGSPLEETKNTLTFFKVWSLYIIRAKKRIIITTITEIIVKILFFT